MPDRPRRRRWPWFVAGTAALLVIGLVVATLTVPYAVAYVCPGCYGLDELRDEVYVESGQTADQLAEIGAVLDTADQKIKAFYGTRQSAPRILICRTAGCYHDLGGGGEKGRAFLDKAFMLAPAGINPAIASHELSHVEFHARLDGATVPQWFDEGLAVVVSDDARYLKPAGAADRCLVEPAGPLPTTFQDWVNAGDETERYAQAGCAVSRWLTAHGGPPAVLDLIDDLRAGEPFAAG